MYKRIRNLLKDEPELNRVDCIEAIARSDDAEMREVKDVVSSSMEETAEPPPKSYDKVRWKVVSASVVGTSHQKTGLPCQDSNYYRIVGDFLVAAVADGAGSAKLSQEGSALASQASVDKACELVGSGVESFEEVLASAFSAAKSAIESKADSCGNPIRDYATTLIVAVCMPDRTVVGQIGDGASVAMLKDSQEHKLLVQPQRGEYVNETQFITSRGWRDSLRLIEYDEGVEFLTMFTDGLEHLALVSSAGSAPHAPFFNPLLIWTKEQECEDTASKILQSFLKSPRFASRADDDLTLLLALRENERTDA